LPCPVTVPQARYAAREMRARWLLWAAPSH
jgi:hypothetical protein